MDAVWVSHPVRKCMALAGLKEMTPLEALEKYKINSRPKECSACPRRAYYDYPLRGFVCSLCLLDLVNVGGTEWNWDDYPEIWNRYANI